MNKIIKIIKTAFVFICVLLFALAILLPAITLEGGNEKVNIFFIDLVRGNSLFSYLGEVSITQNGLNILSFSMLVVFIATPFCALVKNKSLKIVGLASSIVILSYAISLREQIKVTKEILSNSPSVNLNSEGITLFFVASIFSFIFIVIEYLLSSFSNQILSIISKPNKSTEELLKENAELLNQGLITKEEAEERKVKILGDIK